MGLTKNEIFSAEQNKMAAMAKSLGHPARIAIIEYLLRAKSCICGDIVGELGLAQATVSQHLKELKTIGIIKGDVEGTSVCYCINEKVWDEFQMAFDLFFKAKPEALTCC